jgi:hypothetical protein
MRIVFPNAIILQIIAEINLKNDDILFIIDNSAFKMSDYAKLLRNIFFFYVNRARRVSSSQQKCLQSNH